MLEYTPACDGLGLLHVNIGWWAHAMLTWPGAGPNAPPGARGAGPTHPSVTLYMGRGSVACREEAIAGVGVCWGWVTWIVQ